MTQNYIRTAIALMHIKQQGPPRRKEEHSDEEVEEYVTYSSSGEGTDNRPVPSAQKIYTLHESIIADLQTAYMIVERIINKPVLSAQKTEKDDIGVLSVILNKYPDGIMDPAKEMATNVETDINVAKKLKLFLSKQKTIYTDIYTIRSMVIAIFDNTPFRVRSITSLEASLNLSKIHANGYDSVIERIDSVLTITNRLIVSLKTPGTDNEYIDMKLTIVNILDKILAQYIPKLI
jgi:hypothetical protein